MAKCCDWRVEFVIVVGAYLGKFVTMVSSTNINIFYALEELTVGRCAV